MKILVLALNDIVETLANADPADKDQLYQELGISLIYRPDGLVKVTAMPRGLMVRVGGTDTYITYTVDPHVRGP